MPLASRIATIRTAIVARFLPSNALAVEAKTGHIRLAAVAHYLHGQATNLRAAHDAARAFPELGEGEAAMLQAGAASAEAMGDLLNAILDGDRDAAKAILQSFVNGAVDDGIVTV